MGAILAATTLAAASAGAASVEPYGYTNSFDVQPLAADFGSASRPGVVNDVYDMDEDVNAMISVGMATNRVISSTLNPPGSLAQAGWSSTGRYLQLRPTGGRYTVLMGKFVNNTGTNATEFTIAYRHTIAGNPALEETNKGLRVYYSFTGATNSWINLAALNTTATNGTFDISTNIAASWPFGTNLYVLWVDDNAPAPTDVANQIDDFSLQITAGAAPTVIGILDTPTNNAVFFSDATFDASVSVFNGTPPYVVQFWTNSGVGNTVFQSAGSDSNAPYSITLGPLVQGIYNLYATVTDENGAGTVTNSLTNRISVVNALVRLVNPTNGQIAAVGNPLLITATASVGASLSVSNVQFFFDGAPISTDNTAPYTASVPATAEGSHTVYAVATDSLGRATFSTTNQVTFAIDPLANNNFANRFALATPASVAAANEGASTEGGEPTFFFQQGMFAQWGATLWWSWVAPFSASVTIDTLGSDFNTFLSVYTGTAVNALSLVVQNDNAPGVANVSSVTFNAVAGTEYQIQVGGVRAGFQGPPAVGNIRLNLSMPPFAAITNSAGSVFTAGTPFDIGVVAASPAGVVTNVSLYRGSTLLGTDTTAPYSFVVNNAPAGSNALYAVAFDDIGQVGTSAVVRVFIANAGITIASPVDGSIVGNSTPLPISVFAAPPAGSITNVRVFVDNVEIGQDSSAPFTVSWENPTGGSHRLTAVGTADNGATYNSQIVYIGIAGTFISSNSVWKYLDDGSDQGTGWTAPEFSDATWAEGPAPLGYSDSNGRQPLTTVSFGPDPNAKFITTYFRHAFQASGGSAYTNLVMNLQRDDGAVVYLNGVEVGRFNMPTGAITYVTTPPATANDDGGATLTSTFSTGLLRDGLNVVAVEIHQDSGNSSDIWFVLDLVGVPIIDRNQLPTVTLTSPANDASFVAPASIALAADAADSDGSVVRVEFFANDIKLGESTNAPFTATWINPAVGPHLVYAIATDDHGAQRQSAAAAISVYDVAGNPIIAITSPTNSTVVEGPTNMLVTATADAQDAVVNVEFFVDGASIGSDATSPYAVLWNAPFGVHDLSAIVTGQDGKRGTSAVVNVTITIPPTNTVAPVIFRQLPLASSDVTNASFSSVTVIFSERVQNVDAADLLVNGVPATGVTGSGSNYVFTFTRPPYGNVLLTFAPGHGITDFGYPSPLPFNEGADSASWNYEFLDVVAPTIVARSPVAGVTVTNLALVTISFSEAVTGVNADDLLVNGTPAFAFSGSGADYTFNVIQPPSGTVNVTWATNHGIADLGLTGPPIPFNASGAGATWSFTLDARTSFVSSNSTWRFLRGLAEASVPSDAWRQLSFDDSSWSASPAPFVFGEPTFTNALNPGTVLNDMASNAYSSIFLRQTFVVSSLKGLTNALLRHQSDDGFIAWLNGTEIFRYNMLPGSPAFNGSAAANAPEAGNTNGVAYLTATLTSAVPAFVIGTNVLAIQAFNYVTNPPSGDFAFNAQFYGFITDDSFAPPRVVSVDPAPGDVFVLTNITVIFSEAVTNVDAADLLVNGVAASSMTSSSNTSYTFTFDQPAYGPVVIRWAQGHGIVDFDVPPKPFNGNLSSSIFNYALVNPRAPTIVSQAPVGGTTITGLTSIAITFSEAVTGVDAADLLINGGPSASVSGSGSNYVFGVLQPAYGIVTVRWATNHGIQDLELPANAFDGTRPAHNWSYSLVDPVPRVTMTSPTNGAYMTAPANVPLRATATDNDGTILTVEYYEYFEGVSLGEATNAPFFVTWSNAPLGTYTIRAIATDNTGLRGTSAPVIIRVVTEIPALLVRGPYLQSGSPTGAVVRWRTDQRADSIVRYGTSLDALTNVAIGNPTNTEHVVRIGGLEPDTKYYYSIGSSNLTLAGGASGLGDGSNYWFITSPVPGTPKPTRIWVLGDAGTAGNGSPDRQRSTRDAFYAYAARTKQSDIWMMLGDNAYNSGTDTEHQAAVFDMYPETLRNQFLWPTLGNHETAQSTTATDFPYLDIFTLPTQGEAGGVPSGTEKYYSFDYGNIHFICLDSMTSGRTTNTAMAQWLRNDLENSMQEWNIVFFHHPPYTKGSHDSDAEGDLVEIRRNLVPILEEYGVDLVLSGHSHCYERSYLLHGQYGLSSTINATNKVDPGDGREDGTGAYSKTPAQKGVIYTVAGSSGQATGGQLNHPAHFISLNQLGTMVIDVTGNRLDAIFLTSSGATNDHFTLLKRPVVNAPISIVINGAGKVGGVTNGQVLTVGETYQAVATPDPGWAFVGWTGGVTNSSSVLNFVMESNLVLIANFTTDGGPTTSPLTLLVNGSGTVTGATNGQSLTVGLSYTLVAQPAPGWVFANWSGGVSSTAPTLNFVMQPNLSVVANFVPDSTGPRPDQLTLAIRGQGTVSGAVSGQILEIGQSYTIVATPAPGWVFANWSGGVSGSSATLTFVMQSNLVIVANFVEQGGTGEPFPSDQLTLSIQGEGSVSGATNGQTLLIGNGYTLVATPAPGWAFANWSGGVSGSSPTLNFTMVSNLVIVANFVEQIGTNIPSNQITVVVDGNGSVEGVTNGQPLQVGQSYTVTAVPADGWVFANWSGGVSGSSPTITFVMQSNMVVVANFVPQGTNAPFVPVAGTFNGLFFEPDLIDATHSGFFTLKLNSSGSYNASIRTRGRHFNVRGQFGSDGLATNRLTRAGSDLFLVWQADLNDEEVITGSVTDGEWAAPLLGYRDVYNVANPAPQAGRYTLLIPGTPESTDSPAGDGFATVVVDVDGTVRLKGRLAERSVLTHRATLSRDGDWPLYVPLHNGRGVLLGWLHFGDNGAADLSGPVRWVKPSRASDRFYPEGFAVNSDTLGSRYAAPTGSDSVLAITEGVVILDGGNLPDSMNPVTLGSRSRLVNNGPNKLKLTFNPANGRFTGTFREAGSNVTFPISGVVLQRQNFGSGFAPGSDQSGRVRFQTAP